MSKTTNYSLSQTLGPGSALAFVLALVLTSPCLAEEPFSIETQPQHPLIHPIAPEDGAEAVTNPPPMVFWYVPQAAVYILEMSKDDKFSDPTIVKGIDLPFYNHHAILTPGKWFWRYQIVTKEGRRSEYSPTRSFLITPDSIPFPVPPIDEIMEKLPGHPRIYLTRATLGAYRERKNKEAKQAFVTLVRECESARETDPPEPKLGSKMPPDAKARGIAFWLKDGEGIHSLDVSPATLENASVTTEKLAMLYLITSDKEYARAAREWLLWQANFRLDYHQKERAHHDTVHCYEYGLKRMAVVYDYLYDVLSPEQRRKVLDHIEYHGEACYRKLRFKRQIHLKYQTSHAQQDMHELVTTALAVANDLPAAKEWLDYLIRQYVNRLAWGKNDGGYSEGHYYNYKWHGMIQCALALKTATGIDLFKKPRFRNAGRFWLYCMSLSYWWDHFGDNFPLISPLGGSGNDRDGANFLASLYRDRYVKWWADQIDAPLKQPLWYLSDETLKEKPPLDIPQAAMFPDVGWVAMYDKFYDNQSTRLFFKSSPWGSHSHSHRDQNSFVIHAFGEILAIDKGYYGYYGDEYHKLICQETKSHNTVLVNNEGQGRGIEFNGKITDFVNTREYCFATGDATAAYHGKLTTFLRSILFIRPNYFVIHDQLQAPEPSKFSWQLNAFLKMRLDEAAQIVTIKQRDVELKATHLLPGNLTYRQSNERQYELKCRYTEAFPEQWTCWCETSEKSRELRFLTVLEAYKTEAGPTLTNIKKIESEHLLGLSCDINGERCVVLFQRDIANPVRASVEGIETDAKFACVFKAPREIDVLSSPPPLDLTLEDSHGGYKVPMEHAVDRYGSVFHFVRLDPREQGRYTIATDVEGAQILVQDRWDPAHNSSGRDVELREGSMLIVRTTSDRPIRKIGAKLARSYKGQIVNLLRNGDFETGIPGYPPVGWWVRHFRTGDMSYPHWSDENPAKGKHCLKLFREKGRIRCYSQGIDLTKPGRYVFRFKAKATCKGAALNTSWSRQALTVHVEPSKEWKEYCIEGDMTPHRATIHAIFDKADGPNQILWVDDIEFGRIAK